MGLNSNIISEAEQKLDLIVAEEELEDYCPCCGRVLTLTDIADGECPDCGFDLDI